MHPKRRFADLIAAITTDAYGDDEQLWAFRQAFEDHVPPPTSASLLGMPVTVRTVDYGGNLICGLIARCRRDGVEGDVTLADLRFSRSSVAGWLHAAYRVWLGVEPFPASKPPGWQIAGG